MFKKTWKMKLFGLSLILLLGLMLVTGGCADTKTEELHLYVAAGLKTPMEEVIAAYEEETGVKVIPNFGPSGGLYTQIDEGQPCDLYFSADWLYIEKLEELDKLTKSTEFLQDHVVVIVSDTGKDKVSSVEDFVKPNVVVGVCDTNAPVGSYSEAALKNLDLWDELNSSGNLKARPSTVNQLAIMVQEDELDAGMIYSSVATLYGIEWVQEISHDVSGEIIFGAGIIKGGNEASAQKFLDTAFENVAEFTAYGWQEYK